MESINLIYKKLEQFTRKYYTNLLIKGIIFFIGIGLLYFLLTLLLEYFLWLSPVGRSVLFWMFITVEVFLFVRLICLPIFKLFKIQKGLSNHEASNIIGNHFPEVNDKLTNFLQLDTNSEKSELLLASISQKADNLRFVPFTSAVNFKSTYKFLPLAIIPIILFLLFFVSGNADVITKPMSRVVNYNQRFSPPAPFEFLIENKNLVVNQGDDFILKVKTIGKIIPDQVKIILGSESYFLESTKPGFFEYQFTKPNSDIDFYIQANQVTSNDLKLSVIKVPVIGNFEMQLQFPSYLNRKSEIIKGSGNAIIPEGTKVTWLINALSTDFIEWTDGNDLYKFNNSNNKFLFTKSISENIEYQILSSNSNKKHHEKLQYKLAVLKDAYPNIIVGKIPDSLGISQNILVGEVSDDYGLSKLLLVYYDKNNPSIIKSKKLSINNGVFDRFHYQFPDGIDLSEGVTYEYYFEVFDNDAIHNFKSSKSSVFSHNELTSDQKQDENLKEQSDNINSLTKSIKSQEKQLSELDKLQQLHKEKSQLDFKDQKKIDDFLKRQEEQDKMMKSFSEKLKENLKDFNTDKEDKHKELLEQRLEKTQEEIEKNKKLLDELKELSDKLQKEELFNKMDKLQQQAKSQQKSLEQIVELTKRFYVEKKLEKLASDLDKLSKEQNKLSEESQKNNTSEKQDDLNKQFDKLQKDIQDLKKENESLKNPMDVPVDKKDEESIKDSMKDAKEDLQKNQSNKAKQNQKKASDKMKSLSQQLKSSLSAMQGEQLEEDAKLLRQILDNLLAFSFSQEDVMKKFSGTNRNNPSYGNYLKIQHNLKTQFKHVDDSLFALSLRNPKIGEDINKDISEIHYNLDKSIEELAESNIGKGTSHQQFTITTANKLAEQLSNVQESMQMQMSGSGAGNPKPGKSGDGDMQLPDIIKKQDDLLKKMQDGMKSGESPGEGKDGKQGESPSGDKPDSKSSQNKSNGQGKSSGGDSGNDGEGDAESLYEIYKEQQQLREALQKHLNEKGLGGIGQNANKQLKDIEKQLLNKGFSNSVIQSMKNIKHELLKLDKAVREQGEDDKRNSNYNKTEFINSKKPLDPKIQDYLNSIEILNRDALPLYPIYNQKVQQYFKK